MPETQTLLLWMPEKPNIKLRSITRDDIETLRIWKNLNRFSFFFQEIIEPEQQLNWYEQFCTRDRDYMFIVQYDDVDIGCLGFRWMDGNIDIYNVILGNDEYAGKHIMSTAICLLNAFIADRFTEAITAKVLRNNSALDWYLKNGFEIIEKIDTHYLIQYSDRLFINEVKYKILEK